jgi:hypothetical protein
MLRPSMRKGKASSLPMYPTMPQQSRDASVDEEEGREEGGPSMRCFCVTRNLLSARICVSILEWGKGEGRVMEGCEEE